MFADRLRYFMNKRNLTGEKIAAILDVSKGSVIHWANGRRFPKNEDTIKSLAKILGVSVSDLFNETEEMPSIQVDSNYIELPTIHAGAGAVGYAVDNAERRVYPSELIPPHIALDENALVIIVAGNSMEPMYYENDVVFIDMVNGREFIPVNGTYLVRYGDTVQIKDVEFLGNGDILLSSRNSKALIQPVKDLGVEWEIVGKPYVNLHATVGSKLKML